MPPSSPPRIFDPDRRAALARRAEHLSQAPDAARFILDDMVDDVLERLAFMRHEPARCLLIGDRRGILARSLAEPGREIIAAEPGSLDEERPLPFAPLDLIVSLSSLATVNDLPGALIHMRNALAPGGLMLASFVGAGSLPILRQAMFAADGDRPASRMHPMVDNRSGAELLQRSGFARQVVDSRPLRVSYRSFDQFIADLRTQGLTSVLASHTPPLTKSALETARKTFMDRADDQGRVLENFEILTLTGWKS
ncbi:methyltransferase domain-containing protein [Allopontixanthobacter sediminis]|uniref:Methyltransferase domain-containing protein n=1 Tax=Allopontixanthobacter sediminis TaxID=1689985 RepID=A0A845B0F3_9SPHN|nr:methyltransferase domain-containing protein [Allopontixanthobacter sediminis]MXP43666.1 methyltransferase domain-containing protein [Allopontixanthobacter sediminis]